MEALSTSSQNSCGQSNSQDRREHAPQLTQVDLKTREKRYFSQNGEDGVIAAIFAAIGTTNRSFVEFGASNGAECNTRYLRQVESWTGLMMDSTFEDARINLRKEFVTRENIVRLLEKFAVPTSPDLLSIDVDFNDWYVLRSILEGGFRPRVIVTEYNAYHEPMDDKIVVYNPTTNWDGSNYFGASLLAFQRLGARFGYSLVFCESRGVNAFFVSNDALRTLNCQFVGANDINVLYRPPRYGVGPKNGHPMDPRNRPYVSSLTAFDDLTLVSKAQ